MVKGKVISSGRQLKDMDWCFEHRSEVTDKLGRFCFKRLYSDERKCSIGHIEYYEYPPTDKKEKEACCKCCCCCGVGG